MRCFFRVNERLVKTAFDKRILSKKVNHQSFRFKTSTSGGEKKWWSRTFEIKVIGTFIIGVMSWFVDRSINRSQARQQLELKEVNRKIRDLYGPLYGNRLVRNTSYKAALGGHVDVEDYLTYAMKHEDVEMIQRWRNYVLKVLHPLDEKAEQLILNKAHLIAAEGDFPKEFEDFLESFAHFKFVVQHWKNEKGQLKSNDEFTDFDFRLEVNSSGITDDRVLDHVTNRYSKLRARQQKLSLDGSDDPQDHKLANSLLKIFK